MVGGQCGGKGQGTGGKGNLCGSNASLSLSKAKAYSRHIVYTAKNLISMTSKWQLLICTDFGKILGCLYPLHTPFQEWVGVGFLRNIQLASPASCEGVARSGERCELLQWGLGQSPSRN